MLRRSTWVFYTGRLRGLVIATDYDGSGFDSYTYLPASTVVNFVLCVSAALNSETLHVAASEEGRDHRDDEQERGDGPMLLELTAAGFLPSHQE